MALILADRVRETSTTTGTGALSLAGAVVGYQTFSSAIGNANTCYYAISNPGVAEWEVGIGTYATSGNTLTRTTIIKSSNSNAAVNFSAGTKDVFVTYPATKSVYLDASSNASALGTPASGTVTNLTGTASININGTVGATTPAAGAFTTLSATGITTVAAGTAALPAIVSTTGTADTGLWFPAADTVAASTAGTERLRIDSSGNVGIGTASPSAKLQVDSSSATYSANIRARNSNFGSGVVGAASGILTVATDMNNMAFYTASNLGVDGASAPTNERMRIDSSGNVGIGTSSPGAKLDVSSGAVRLSPAYQLQWFNGATQLASILADSGPNLTFQTGSSNTERMRISSAGEFLFNTTSTYSAPKMALAFDSSVNNGFVFFQSNNSTGTYLNFFSNSTTQQGSIVNNNNGTVSYANASDYRLKENIVDFDENGLSLISKVKVRRFNRKEYPDATITGFIAHELAEVCPQAVHGEKDAVNENGSIKAQSVDQSYLVPFLVKAMQEQQALITTLTTRIAALEAKA